MKEMKLDRLSSEEIVSMFEDAYETQVASKNDISNYSVECGERKTGQPMEINVEIAGFAGTPTVDQFKNGELEAVDKVVISREDIGEKTFKLVPNLTIFLQGNDYVVVYVSE